MSLRIVGLDTSLSKTGIAVVDVGLHAVVREIATIKSKPTPKADYAAMLQRIGGIVREIRRYTLQGEHEAVAVAMEGPSYAAQGSAVHDIAGLWWAAYGEVSAIANAVVIIPPAILKMYVTGKGNAPKDLVLMSIVRQHDALTPADNNEADALGLAAMVARQIGHRIETRPLAHHDAVLANPKIVWPSLLTAGRP
jgi:crossover junction endodeoxyribonuclease RuvC